MMCLVLPLRPGAKSVLVLVDDESSMKGFVEESALKKWLQRKHFLNVYTKYNLAFYLSLGCMYSLEPASSIEKDSEYHYYYAINDNIDDAIRVALKGRLPIVSFTSVFGAAQHEQKDQERVAELNRMKPMASYFLLGCTTCTALSPHHR